MLSRSSASSGQRMGMGIGEERLLRPVVCTAMPPAMCTSCTSPGDRPSINSWESKP